MSGFITIKRDTWDHPVLMRSEMSETEAWVWMIARASWTGTTHMVGDNLVDVERGSFMITLRKLQSEFMWKSDKKVRNFLKKLENHGMLAVQTLGQRNARKTHVTICNYDKYQAGGRSKDAAKTHGGRTADAVKKQGNKGTNKDNKDTDVSLASKAASKKKSFRGSRLSEDWFIPTEWGEWAVSEGWTENTIRAESDKFKDYWLSVAGSKGVKLDWQRTWKNWMRNNKTPKIIVGGRHGTNTHSTNGIASGRSGRDPALEQISRLTGI